MSRLAIIIAVGLAVLSLAMLVPESAKEDRRFSALMYVAIVFALIVVAYYFIASAVRRGVSQAQQPPTGKKPAPMKTPAVRAKSLNMPDDWGREGPSNPH